MKQLPKRFYYMTLVNSLHGLLNFEIGGLDINYVSLKTKHVIKLPRRLLDNYYDPLIWTNNCIERTTIYSSCPLNTN